MAAPGEATALRGKQRERRPAPGGRQQRPYPARPRPRTHPAPAPQQGTRICAGIWFKFSKRTALAIAERPGTSKRAALLRSQVGAERKGAGFSPKRLRPSPWDPHPTREPPSEPFVNKISSAPDHWVFILLNFPPIFQIYLFSCSDLETG